MEKWRKTAIRTHKLRTMAAAVGFGYLNWVSGK